MSLKLEKKSYGFRVQAGGGNKYEIGKESVPTRTGPLQRVIILAIFVAFRSDRKWICILKVIVSFIVY